ncbi:hypothetical protein BJP40_06795 [Streptomyces sp. CC53]|nr:hypothetical protein BJP40_06795 [Streptomyces sp. CC53]
MVVFSGDNFLDGGKWNIGRSSAYPGGGPGQTNYGDNKADYIHPTNAPSLVHDADLGRLVWRFRATRRGPDAWDTPLATTEYVPGGGGFEIRPGDTMTAKLKLPAERGAWPAYWTWGRDNPPGYGGVQPGHGEVDMFEYHPNNPDLLELSNRVSGGGHYYRNSQVVQPGRWIDMRVDFGTDGVVWRIDGQHVFTANGLPSYWRAWPIVNLSIVSAANPWHPEPLSSVNTIDFYVADFKVWRP